MNLSSQKRSSSQYVEGRLRRLESDFVKCKDLLEYNDYIDEKDHEGFYVIPSAGDGVIGRYKALRDMEDDTPNIIVRKTVYDKLCMADAALKRKSGYRNCQIVVTYGYRSPRIQKALWEATYEEKKMQYPDLTEEELREIVHMEIAFPDVAGHPTGGAVDVTIYNFETSTYLDMGTEIGDFTSKNVYYKSSNISNEAKKNRKALRSVMCEHGGFAPYDGEWWHFCYGDKEWACYTARRRSRNEHSAVTQKVLYRQKEIDDISEIAYNDKVKTHVTVIDDPFRVRMAVQKDGRLTEETLSILRQSGISITQDKRGFLAKSSNFPLEVLFVRDDDISNLVDAGVADIGIVGENVYRENGSKSIIKKRLGFGKCFLALAVPKNSDIRTLRDLKGKRIATSYRNLTAQFLREKEISDVEIIDIAGSVEIAPLIDYADAIVDLVSTGGSLKQNNLEVFFNILNSESILIVNNQSETDSYKRRIIDKLIERINSYLEAKKYKKVMMNVPKANLDKIINVIISDSTNENASEQFMPDSRKKSDNNKIKAESPIIYPVYGSGDWFSLVTVMKVSDIWDKTEILKSYRACNIVFSNVEGIIN